MGSEVSGVRGEWGHLFQQVLVREAVGLVEFVAMVMPQPAAVSPGEGRCVGRGGAALRPLGGVG